MKTINLFIVLILLMFSISSKADQHWGGHLSSNLVGSNENIYIDSTIYSNGYNISIYSCNVYVAQNQQIRMEHNTSHIDTLICDYDVSRTPNVFRGQGSQSWLGIFCEKAVININHSRILDVKKNSGVNYNYALACFTPINFNFDYSTIIPHSSVDSSCSGILISYSQYLDYSPNIYIGNDSLLVNGDSKYAINIYYGYGQVTGSYDIENNFIKHTVGGSAAVLLVGLLDVTLYNNNFREWNYSVYGYSSTVNLWDNYLNSSISVYQLHSVNASIFDLSSNAGGYNTVLTDDGACIYVDGAYFDTHNGGNYFVKQDTSTGYFFDGFFASTYTDTTHDARGNCFFTSLGGSHLDSARIKFNVKLSNNVLVKFRLLPFGDCGDNAFLNNSINNLNKDAYSMMKASVKTKDYNNVISMSKQVLAKEKDQMKSIEALRKLYYAASLLYGRDEISESAQKSKFRELKNFYQNYCNDKSNSPESLEEAQLLLQNCKIVLEEYSSALKGYNSLITSGKRKLEAKWAKEKLLTYMNSKGSYNIPNAMSNEELTSMILNDIDNLINTESTQTRERDNSSSNTIPAKYLLNQNYPNPFNPVTSISYTIPTDGFVNIKVYDIIGKLVAEIVNEYKSAGNYSVEFNGSEFSSGVYFYKMETPDFVQTKRMVLMK